MLWKMALEKGNEGKGPKPKNDENFVTREFSSVCRRRSLRDNGYCSFTFSD